MRVHNLYYLKLQNYHHQMYVDYIKQIIVNALLFVLKSFKVYYFSWPAYFELESPALAVAAIKSPAHVAATLAIYLIVRFD